MFTPCVVLNVYDVIILSIAEILHIYAGASGTCYIKSMKMLYRRTISDQ